MFSDNKNCPSAIKRCIQTLLFIFMFTFTHGQDRKITAKLNPGCSHCSSDTILVYIKCDGAKDTIHQIWDFTRHTPSVILAVSSLASVMNITWDRSMPKEFSMSEKPQYSFAVAIDKLYEYDDLDDNGHIEPRFPQREYNLDRVSWTLDKSLLNDKEAMVEVTGRIDDYNHGNGSVRIKLDLIPFKDYAVELPHLIHTANSTLLDVSLVGLPSRYNSSRYAIHLLLASTDDVADTMHYTMRKSLDDEHTPGIFEIIEIKSPALYENSEGGYLQFRPVGYTQRERSVGTSTVAHVSPFNRTTLPRQSSLRMFYRSFAFSAVLVQDIFVSFGEAGDGFYKNHNYTDWSFTMGYGSPPVESFSLFVVLVISIGLAVPVLLAVSGVVYVLAVRRRALPLRRLPDDD